MSTGFETSENGLEPTEKDPDAKLEKPKESREEFEATKDLDRLTMDPEEDLEMKGDIGESETLERSFKELIDESPAALEFDQSESDFEEAEAVQSSFTETVVSITSDFDVDPEGGSEDEISKFDDPTIKPDITVGENRDLEGNPLYILEEDEVFPEATSEIEQSDAYHNEESLEILVEAGEVKPTDVLDTNVVDGLEREVFITKEEITEEIIAPEDDRLTELDNSLSASESDQRTEVPETPEHAYTVVGTTVIDGSEYIALRNPWEETPDTAESNDPNLIETESSKDAKPAKTPEEDIKYKSTIPAKDSEPGMGFPDTTKIPPDETSAESQPAAATAEIEVEVQIEKEDLIKEVPSKEDVLQQEMDVEPDPGETTPALADLDLDESRSITEEVGSRDQEDSLKNLIDKLNNILFKIVGG